VNLKLIAEEEENEKEAGSDFIKKKNYQRNADRKVAQGIRKKK